MLVLAGSDTSSTPSLSGATSCSEGWEKPAALNTHPICSLGGAIQEGNQSDCNTQGRSTRSHLAYGAQLLPSITKYRSVQWARGAPAG